jgi:hypothetical protein
MTTSSATTHASPGPRAFDVLFGKWTGHHNKIRDNTDPDCTEWVEFEAEHETFPVLGGLAHIDVLSVPAGQPVAAFEALTVRLYDPDADTWSIYWLSSRKPGVMDPPVVGPAHATGGIFECDDVVGGRPVRVRYVWEWSDPARPVYRQDFAAPGTAEWVTNWESTFSRRD